MSTDIYLEHVVANSDTPTYMYFTVQMFEFSLNATYYNWQVEGVVDFLL